MYNEIFIKNLSTLGETILDHINGVNRNLLLNRAVGNAIWENIFFTQYMQHEALRAIANNFLKEELLREWCKPVLNKGTIGLDSGSDISVGVIMAGNIPLVGFHDLLSVLAVGYKVVVKRSSKDSFLVEALVDILGRINKYWINRIEFVTQLSSNLDMIIASGRHETMEVIRDSYGSIPLLLRGNKFSVAVIKGDENDDSLRRLGRDMFLYFGFGCRSVSTLLFPLGYDFRKIVNILKAYIEITEVADYRAAYRYAKAQAMMDGELFIDGDFYIMKRIESMPPAQAVIGVEYYRDKEDVDNFILNHKDNLQCVVNYNFNGSFVEFGNTQKPALDEYADGINTIDALLKI